MPPALPSRVTAPTPATEDDVIALVRAGAPIATIGNGTKRHLGPATSATVVSLRQLARVTAYEPGDMVVSVQPGVRLAELQKTLAPRGQWLPIDPPYPTPPSAASWPRPAAGPGGSATARSRTTSSACG